MEPAFNSKDNKTRSIFFRAGLLLLAIVFGSLIFWLLTIAGQKSKGPLDDLLTSANRNLSHLEKDIFTAGESRADKLGWFDMYRKNKKMISSIDTILFGAYDDNTAESYHPIVSLEDSIDVNLPVISIYTAWGSKRNQVFPALRAQAIYDLGSIPMITWEPWLDDFDPNEFPVVAGKKNKNLEGLKEIAAGKFDAYIDEWAIAAKQFAHPFFLRFGHEMNDPYRYPWGPPNNTPQDFINAWRHVLNRFKAFGADNAIWIWSPHPAYTTYPQFYPGHEYVDWIGITSLNYGNVASWSQWWSFDEIFGKFYDSVSSYKKPMMVTEFGSLAVGGDRAGWFYDALDSITMKYPALKAIVFFHVRHDNTTSYKTLDWSFENDNAVTGAVKKSIKMWRQMKRQKK